jgi:hypothetical protein
MSSHPFIGPWRIVWMSGWEADYVDMDVPGHVTFDADRSGSFQFGMVQAQMDCSITEPSAARIEFS